MSSVWQEESLLDLLLGVESQSSAPSPGEPEEELRNHVSQRLQRELTSFFNLLLPRLTHTTDRLLPHTYTDTRLITL